MLYSVCQHGKVPPYHCRRGQIWFGRKGIVSRLSAPSFFASCYKPTADYNRAPILLPSFLIHALLLLVFFFFPSLCQCCCLEQQGRLLHTSATCFPWRAQQRGRAENLEGVCHRVGSSAPFDWRQMGVRSPILSLHAGVLFGLVCMDHS